MSCNGTGGKSAFFFEKYTTLRVSLDIVSSGEGAHGKVATINTCNNVQ